MAGRARNIGAVLLGLVVGSALNMALVAANTALFPMPEGVTWEDQEAFAAHVRAMPPQGFLLVFAAHLGQAGLGGWIAARLGASRPMLLAGIVGGLTLLGTVMNLVALKPPAWTWVEVPLVLGVTWLAGSLEATRRAG